MNEHQNKFYANVRGLSPAQRYVLERLTSMANKHGYAWPSIARICEDTGYSKRNVIYVLAILEGHGLIERHQKRGKNNTYFVNLPEIPTTYPKPQRRKLDNVATNVEEEEEKQGSSQEETETFVLSNVDARPAIRPGFEKFKAYRKGEEHASTYEREQRNLT